MPPLWQADNGKDRIKPILMERKQTILSETGKFLIDIAKLVFGGIILAGIMKYESINTAALYSIGGVAVLMCFAAGLFFIALSKNK